MTLAPMKAGYIALVDAAPLIVARELGFAETEGLDLQLQRAPSWSTLRDLLALGRIEAAHMLAPIPVAMALGLGGLSTRIDVLSVLSTGGQVVGVSAALARRLRDGGHGFDFADAAAAARALLAEPGLRIGAPFPFSTHAELLHHWLAPTAGGPLDIRTVPPPLMAQAMAEDEIDAFCVGEPWGSIAVETGLAELLLPGCAIRAAAPDKVLAVRRDWAEAEPELTGKLMRAVWRAGRWLGTSGNLATASEILAPHLDVAPELIDRALTGRLVIAPGGDERLVPGFIGFFDGAATFPWRSQAAWFGSRLARRSGRDPAAAIATARGVFRTDLYRKHLRAVGADLPGASDRLEGAITTPTEVPAEQGRVSLAPDAFFDGQIFDPEA